MRQVFVLLLCDNSSDQSRRDAHKPIQLTPLQMLLEHQTSDQEPNREESSFCLGKLLKFASCILMQDKLQKEKK